MTDKYAHVQEQFEDRQQQHETSVAGMWLFLSTEVMFFGALFAVYVVYWYTYPDIWKEFSKHTDAVLGTINTAVLLTSSLTVALAVQAAHAGNMRHVARLYFFSALLGCAFLLIKGVEWSHEIKEGLYPGSWGQPQDMIERGNMFFRLYFVLTGLHALHVIIGIILLTVMAVFAVQRRYSADYYTPIEVSGLYWHFVDLVWIFLFPLLYLVERSA